MATVTACPADPSGAVLTGLAMYGVAARATVTAVTTATAATAPAAAAAVSPGVPAIPHGIGS
ncbi:hypothetical protein [Mycolicibacter engbaekii]|uniref:hypothetical protein n=1 Tax=Mycolicibacter engbaekii TaxID=188915 RepID=UPI0013FD75AE|nr:hypothetical protein [Mycolicibacter engbaekii]